MSERIETLVKNAKEVVAFSQANDARAVGLNLSEEKSRNAQFNNIARVMFNDIERDFPSAPSHETVVPIQESIGQTRKDYLSIEALAEIPDDVAPVAVVGTLVAVYHVPFLSEEYERFITRYYESIMGKPFPVG